MKIQITQQNFTKALSLLSRVASTRTSLPILSNVLLDAKNGSLKTSATNLEVAISHETVGKISDEGQVTVPARLLHDFVSQLPKEEVIDLIFEKNKLFVNAGSFSSTIQGSNSEDFPALPELTDNTQVNVASLDLKNALSRVMLAASNDETRPVLGGVYFHTNEGKLYIAATDGYRLAESVVSGSDDEIKAIVPASSLQDTMKIINDSNEDNVKLQFDESQFGVVVSSTKLVSRLVDGEYPAYQQLIPVESDVSFVVNKDNILTAAKLAGLFAREVGGSITLKVDDSKQTVSINSVASQVGDNSSVLKSSVSGSGEIVLNVRYLTDALNCFDTKEVSMRFSGSISPCVITSEQQPGYKHIVMPLKS